MSSLNYFTKFIAFLTFDRVRWRQDESWKNLLKKEKAESLSDCIELLEGKIRLDRSNAL